MIANPKGCPGLEDIAALAEGRLSGAERERVVGHVAGCRECREVLAGMMGALREVRTLTGARSSEAEVPDRPPGPATNHWTRSWPAGAASLAAAVLVVAGVVAYKRLAAPSVPDRREWLASMPPAETLVPELWGGVVIRGGEHDGELARQSAELGALLVDLEIAIAAGDANRSAELARRMAAIIEHAGLLDEDAAALRGAVSEGGRLGEHELSEVDLLELSLRLRRRFVPLYLDLGGYLEQVRIAALAGRPEFLDSPSSRRYLDWVLSHEGRELPVKAAKELSVLRQRSSSAQAQAEAATRALRVLTR